MKNRKFHFRFTFFYKLAIKILKYFDYDKMAESHHS